MTNEELELENEKLKKQIEELKAENLHLKLESTKYLAIRCNLRTLKHRMIFYDEDVLGSKIGVSNKAVLELMEKIIKDGGIKFSCHKDPRTMVHILEAEFTYLKPDWWKEEK